MPKQKNNSERINVFFSPEILARLKRIADRKGISVSGLVRMIVLDKLNKEEVKKSD
jgi:cytidylate kinase